MLMVTSACLLVAGLICILPAVVRILIRYHQINHGDYSMVILFAGGMAIGMAIGAIAALSLEWKTCHQNWARYKGLR